ncbi:MAG: hypothetical protein CVV39_03000 [Planctomycetes bacterium HGW-Planctomycetes-1]|nr:MAG: hypothetical protein CVV39_03000 [Planctomycetes bacterium HGW-Planctomycetes-1]
MIFLTTRQKQRKAAAVFLLLLLGVFVCPAAMGDGNVVLVKNVWVDVPLSQIFRDISIETHIAISTCPHVPDSLVSLDAAKGKPLDECLNELVAGQGLFVHKKTDKFYLIVCGDISCPTTMSIATSTRHYLRYITAKHLRSSLPKPFQQFVTSGERGNEVFIFAEPQMTKNIIDMINKLDIPREQVVLEVLVVDLWETTSDELGIDWSFSRPHTSFSMTEGAAGFTGVGSYASIAASNLTSLSITLRALVAEKKASIRSRPRVATLNGEKAKIDISLDEYFTIATDLYGTSLRTELEVIKSGVLLEITPYIGDEGDITVDVLTEVSDVASRRNSSGNGAVSNGDLPVIRRRKANTTVRVKEGDAIVIGGLIETQETTHHKRVPLLSSIPIGGGLFKSKQDGTTKKEVMIFITPQLIREGENVTASNNELINEANEIGNLRTAGFDARRENNKKTRKAKEEIKSLSEVVNLLGSQKQPDNAPEIYNPALSYAGNSSNIELERQILQEAIMLLDVKNEDSYGVSGK